MHKLNRSEALARYGAIDVLSGRWPREREFMSVIQIPHEFPNWKYAGTDKLVDHIYVNHDCAPFLVMALKAVKDRGLAHLLKTYDGCFNVRAVRGGTSVSWHSYGLAIDLNASENPLGATQGGFYKHPDFVDCFTEQGWVWGGRFNGRRDPMHWQFGIG